MPRIVISIPMDVLEKIVRSYPGLPPEEAIRQYVLDSLRGGAPEIKEVRPAAPAQISREDISKLQRSIMDLLNPYTAKLDDLSRRLGTIVEILENLAERVANLESSIRELREGYAARAEVPHEVKHRERRSALDFLREQKVMFESEITGRIRNRDAFFERLKRGGAVVLELSTERVAVDPEFWEEFKRKLSELSSSLEKDIVKVLGKEGAALLKALMHDAQVYYDATRKKWVLLVKERD
ncbi:MAG: hypothetical protein J7L12_01930 [Desulfurococcales archaeon]|nr:hypothetical protein [Desulfurococcales archaeon]